MVTGAITAVLDNFDRGNDATTMGGDWTMFGRSAGSYDMGIIDNQLYNPDGGANGWNWIYYDAAQYGPDCEVYATINKYTDKNDILGIYLRLKDAVVDAWTHDGYSLEIYEFGADTLKIIRKDNSVTTELGASVSITAAEGDTFLFRAVGSTLVGYQKTGGVWSEILRRTDATYAAAGYFGFYGSGSSAWRYDDFGGGDLLPVMQKTLTGTPSVALAIASETLDDYVVAYHYEELSQEPGYLAIWLDNRADGFDDLATDWPTLTRGAAVTMSRGLMLDDLAVVEALPRCWVEVLEYTEEGRLLLTCVDWLGALEAWRYNADTEFAAQTHSTTAASILGQVGLTLASGSFGYSTDFTADKDDDGDETLQDLMAECHEALYAGLAAEIQWKTMLPAEAAGYAYDFENGTAEHPLLPESVVQESTARFNRVQVLGGSTLQYSGIAADAAEGTLVGVRTLTRENGTLASDAQCLEEAEALLRHEQAQAVAATLVARPHFTLRMYDVFSVAAPPWGGPALSAGRVIEIIEDYDTRDDRQIIWEQEVTLGDLLLLATAAEEDSGRKRRGKGRKSRRRRRKSRRRRRRSRRQSRGGGGGTSGGGSGGGGGSGPGDTPIGGIIMWSGASAPSGWSLCDGSSGTPDLRDRFVVGAGSSYSVGASGGAATIDIQHSHNSGTLATDSDNHSHTSGTLATDSDNHSHTSGTLATDSDGHTHGSGSLGADSVAPPGTVDVTLAVDHAVFDDVTHSHTVSGSTASDSHSHSVDSGSTAADSHGHDVDSGSTASDSHSHDVDSGSTANALSATQDILPPYYALAFIMRIA